MRRARPYQALTLACLVALVACAPAPSSITPTPTSPTALTLPQRLAGSHIWVSDLATGDVALLGARTYHVSRSVHGLGISSDGRWLYAADVAGSRLVAYPLADGALGAAHTVIVGAQPVHMVNTLDGRRIFVANFAGKSVSVINTNTWTVEKTLSTPDGPHGLVLSPDGRWLYVGCYNAATILVIDAASATIAGTLALPLGAQPYGLALAPNGRYLYASDNLTGLLFTLDVTSPTAGRVIGAVEVGLRPALIARAPDGATLYVASGGAHAVTPVNIGRDPSHPIAGAPIAVPGVPHGLAVTRDGKYVVVANTTGKTLSVIETASNTVVETITAEQYPNDVLVTP